MHYLLLLVLLLFNLQTFAQGENNIWMMGNGMGLDCNYDPPRIIEHPNMQLNEAAATISDADGNLLFYTDNKTVWNARHEVIENGSGILHGGHSAYRGALFVPVPGRLDQILLFNIESMGYPGRLNYSIIDVNHGTGSIQPSNKSINLGKGYSEGMVAIKGTCGRVWLLTRLKSSKKIHLYTISKDGIDHDYNSYSVVQSKYLNGSSFNNGALQKTTSLNYSSAYERLTMTSEAGVIEICDFDTKTGKISNPIAIASAENESDFTIDARYAKSVLSHNGRYLFVAEYDDIYHFDISLPTREAIIASKTHIGSYQPKFSYGDDKQVHPLSGDIYIGINSINDPHRSHPYLARIKRVDDTTYVVEDKFMKMPRVITRGMNFTNPTVVADPPPVAPPPLPDTTICSAISLSISGSGTAYSSIRWSTGDTTAATQIAAAGDYWVEMDIDGCRVVDSFSVEMAAPEVSLTADTTLCDGADWSIRLSDQYGYEWTALPSDSLLSTAPAYTISRSGRYELMTISGDGCMRSDTVSVTIISPLPIDLGDDITLCPDKTATIGTKTIADDYAWSTGDTSPTITTDQAGVYRLVVSTAGCSAADSIRILRDEYCDCSIYIPTAVAPLSSNDNDAWRISSSCPLADYQLRIYDRWGGAVHQSYSPSDHWRAEDVASGVYAYTLSYSLQGRQEVATGTVTVVR